MIDPVREFIDASHVLITVLRAFTFGTEQRDYRVPSIALDEATRRYDTAKAKIEKRTLST